jgi:hypothetical protein
MNKILIQRGTINLAQNYTGKMAYEPVLYAFIIFVKYFTFFLFII